MKLVDVIIKKWFCLHEWEEISRCTIFTASSYRYDMPDREEFTYCCKKCGKFKRVSV